MAKKSPALVRANLDNDALRRDNEILRTQLAEALRKNEALLQALDQSHKRADAHREARLRLVGEKAEVRRRAASYEKRLAGLYDKLERMLSIIEHLSGAKK